MRRHRFRPENWQVDVGPYPAFYEYITWVIESGLQLWALLELVRIFLAEYGAKIMMLKEPIIVLFVFTIVASIVITTGFLVVKSLAWILPHLTWFKERALDYLKWIVKKLFASWNHLSKLHSVGSSKNIFRADHAIVCPFCLLSLWLCFAAAIVILLFHCMLHHFLHFWYLRQVVCVHTRTQWLIMYSFMYASMVSILAVIMQNTTECSVPQLLSFLLISDF